MDILERLNNLLSIHPQPTYADMAIEATLRDAADEIKRLRADVDSLAWDRESLVFGYAGSGTAANRLHMERHSAIDAMLQEIAKP